MPRIYLDMDGVLAAMVAAAIRRLHLPDAFVWPAGVWDFTEATGIPDYEVWSHLADHDFWAWEIQPTDLCFGLVAAAEELAGPANVRILSKPTAAYYSASGKLHWLRKHLPAYTGKYVLAVDKTDCCRPGEVLVDDSPANCKAWTTAGGTAVLVPARHNHRFAESPLVAVDELRAAFGAAACRCETRANCGRG